MWLLNTVVGTRKDADMSSEVFFSYGVSSWIMEIDLGEKRKKQSGKLFSSFSLLASLWAKGGLAKLGGLSKWSSSHWPMGPTKGAVPAALPQLNQHNWIGARLIASTKGEYSTQKGHCFFYD